MSEGKKWLVRIECIKIDELCTAIFDKISQKNFRELLTV